MSIISTLPVFYLENSQALQRLLNPEFWPPSVKAQADWKLWSYAASVQRDASRPDHVFHNRWEKYRKSAFPASAEGDLRAILRWVADEYLTHINGRLYIKDSSDEDVGEVGGDDDLRTQRRFDAFSRWQNIRSRMSVLPVKLLKMEDREMPDDYFLAHPYSPMLADFIKREGLNETHLHLTRCQSPEEAWLADLYNPHVFLQKETANFHGPKREMMKELYATINPELTPRLLANRLRIACVLRETVLELLSGAPSDVCKEVIEETYREIQRFCLNPHLYFCSRYPLRKRRTVRQRVQQELDMWNLAFQALKEESNFPYKTHLQRLLHLYLLLQNEHLRLNRHQEGHNGFNAFDQPSSHGRQSVETQEYYEDTFLRLLRASDARNNNYPEVRVGPWSLQKKEREKLLACWKKACKAWETEKNGGTENARRNREHTAQDPHLIIVVHFHKTAPRPFRENSIFPAVSYLYEREFNRLLKAAAALCTPAEIMTATEGGTMGIDAAGSELNLPPEVFAPAFRLFQRRTRINYRTFHCGEDFYHLIGGIRAVYDAVNFLNLRRGNRVGHATAIGIMPELWLSTMPSKLVLKRRDWFLDLIFAWKLLRGKALPIVARVEREILRLYHLLFPSGSDSEPSAAVFDDLAVFYELRQYVPSHVKWFLDGQTFVSMFVQCEFELLHKVKDKHGTYALKLYQQWACDKKCRRSQEQLEEVAADFLPPEVLLLLQQEVQRYLCMHDVALESLPVSNVRISQYADMQQHHILRWLHVGPYEVAGDAKLTVCLGSDDPGIFVTDIKNEYYHLFFMLRNAGLSTHEALGKLKEVNDNGRIYAFKEAPLSSKDVAARNKRHLFIPPKKEFSLFADADKPENSFPFL